MRSLRSNFVLFFVLLISATILLDSTHIDTKSISDKFEEIPITLKREASFFIFSNRNITDATFKDVDFILEVRTTKIKNNSTVINFVSKIKSYLHLLQLP